MIAAWEHGFVQLKDSLRVRQEVALENRGFRVLSPTNSFNNIVIWDAQKWANYVHEHGYPEWDIGADDADVSDDADV